MNGLVTKDLTTTSMAIAELFGKAHKNVLRTVRKIENSCPDFFNDNFTLSFYINASNVKQPMYNMTKEGFDFLSDGHLGLTRLPMRLREEASLKTIEQLLKITLIRQFKCLNYRIDGYDSVNNVAYEIDEQQHLSDAAKERDEKRQASIIMVLKCKFVRIKI